MGCGEWLAVSSRERGRFSRRSEIARVGRLRFIPPPPTPAAGDTATRQGSAARATAPICPGFGSARWKRGVSSKRARCAETEIPIAASAKRRPGQAWLPCPKVLTDFARRKPEPIGGTAALVVLGVEARQAREGLVPHREQRRDVDARAGAATPFAPSLTRQGCITLRSVSERCASRIDSSAQASSSAGSSSRGAPAAADAAAGSRASRKSPRTDSTARPGAG